jgi:outer membrane protein TolC
MTVRVLGLLACLVSMTSLARVHAAQEVVLSDGISPEEAVQLALQRNQSLIALQRARETAVLKARATAALPDPEIRTSRFNFQNESGGLWSQNYNLALRWSPPRPGERAIEGGAALSRASEVDGAISMARQRIAAEARLLHMDLVFLNRQIELAESLVDVRRRAFEFVTLQTGAALKTLLDQSEAELALAEARSQLESLRLDLRVKRNRFASELGLPTASFSLQVEGNPLSNDLSAPGAVDAPAVFSRRPELAILSAKCSQAEAQLKLGRTARYPWFSFVQVSRDLGGPRTLNSWGFRFGLDLPISKWKNNNLLVPRAELEQCRAETKAEQNRISDEATGLIELLRASSERLAYEARTVDPILNKAVGLAEATVAANESDMLPRFTAEARRMAQQQARLIQLRDYRRLEIELALAMGRSMSQ